MQPERSHFLRAGFLQIEISPADPWANLEKVRQALSRLVPAPGTLLLLPELWATGFVYPKLSVLAEKIPAVIEGLIGLAQEYQVTLGGSLPEKNKEHGGLYNTLFLCDQNGLVGSFRKQHLFTYWHEDDFFVPGASPRPIESPQGFLGGLVCYDLRFPETARTQCQQGANLLMMSAQWPAVRIGQWRILLQARAIENQAFVVACNGSGWFGELELGGHSLVIAPDGEVLLEAGTGVEEGAVALDWAKVLELRGRFNTLAEIPYPFADEDKVMALERCGRLVDWRKGQGQRIVFTNGCFDILHAGHVDYLEKARRQGDFLVVGLNSDSSIRTLKGEGRPVNREEHRARVLAALGCVDAVVLFSEETPLNLINTLRPAVLVKGADWAEDQIVGGKEVIANGGRIERIAFTNDTSTTRVIAKIRQG